VTVADVEALRSWFTTTEHLTVGIEEEVLLVDPETWLPAPVAAEVVARAGDPRVKQELPACQVELATGAHPDSAAALAELASLRRQLVAACGSGCVPVAAAVHPLVLGPMEVASTDRSRALVADYGEVAARQLVSALQVHVAVGDPDRALAVYNALRGYLPEVAALAAAAPFHEGRSSGLASVRPLIAGQLPRQGVPPVLSGWEELVEELRWGAATGWVCDPSRWWWELRPNLRFGTLEVRVPDVQPTIDAAAGVVSLIHALVCHLAERHEAGRELGAPPTWRIAENRWAALRDGVHGELADLETGCPAPTRDRLARLIDQVEPHAPDGLDEARALLERTSADALLDVGIRGSLPWMAEVFAPGSE
jgi:carboxylate-amine ligase